jgi:RNA polymerase sigma factor (sigma-70 family)
LSVLEELAHRARDGDAGALEELLARSQPDLRRFAARLCRTGDDADEAVQHASYVVASRIGTFAAAARFTSWVFAVIKNECARRFRAASRWMTTEMDDYRSDRASPDVALERARLHGRIAEAIGALPLPLRVVFVLRELEGRSTAETADVLGIGEANVKVRLHRARAELRAALAEI